MIVLIGFMGAGKTTIGYLLAEKLGVPFVDIDVLIEHRHQRRVRDIFVEDGEVAFRQLEHDTIAGVLAGPDAIVSLGGGAAEHPDTQRLLADHTVIHLEVTYDEAMLRIGHDVYRPMLARKDVSDLYQRRAPIYRRVATLPITTTRRRPEDIVLEIVTRVTAPPSVPSDLHSVLVSPMGGAYQVHIGPGAARHLGMLLPPVPHAERAIAITDIDGTEPIAVVKNQLEELGLAVTILPIDIDEAKTFGTIERLAGELAALPAHSDDIIVGIGGEEVCDVAGFVAATYNRGMPLVLVPTTLEAQADSAIGGKNSINLPHGLNLVGTVHQPILIVSDIDLALRSDDSPFKAGLAEIVKHGMIADAKLLEDLGASADRILARDPEVLTDLVARSTRIKAAIVTADEREQGDRVFLNYGHTFAHAFEHIWNRDPGRHGDAVALGMMAAAHLAHRSGLADPGLVELHRAVLTAMGLRTTERFDLEALTESFKRDKKYRGGVRFVLLGGVGEPHGRCAVSEEALAKAVEDLAQQPLSETVERIGDRG